MDGEFWTFLGEEEKLLLIATETGGQSGFDVLKQSLENALTLPMLKPVTFGLDMFSFRFIRLLVDWSVVLLP